jgi:hypothetical protein
LLTDGSVIAGEVTAIDGEQVEFVSTRRPGMWKANRLPRALVRAIVFQASANPLERDKLNAKLLAAEAEDRLLMASGDSLSGNLIDAAAASEEDRALRFRFSPPGVKQPLTLDQERIVAVTLGGGKASRNPARFWLGLADGSLLAVADIETKRDDIAVRLPSGTELLAHAVDNDVEPPESFWTRVAFVQAILSRVSYLSDLKTIGFKHVPLLDWPLEFANDRSVAGSRLRAGGTRFIKGIGMPATSRLAYDIPAGAKQFEAEVAIDDAAERAGSVVFRVFLESDEGIWKPAHESKTLRGGDPPQSVEVELGAARRLALVVDMADHGDERDYADWLNARFVK